MGEPKRCSAGGRVSHMKSSDTGQTVFLETFGCQMNVLDSELVLGELRGAGYARVDDPSDADLECSCPTC